MFKQAQSQCCSVQFSFLLLAFTQATGDFSSLAAFFLLLVWWSHSVRHKARMKMILEIDPQLGTRHFNRGRFANPLTRLVEPSFLPLLPHLG